MKHFGEYLLEKKWITEHQLVEALLDQVRSMPTIAEIVVNNRWLSFSEVLEIFSYQSRESVEFKTACQALHFWKPQMDKNLKDEIQKHRTPVGHILCKKGVISAENLAKALEDFISNHQIEFKKVEKAAHSDAAQAKGIEMKQLHDEASVVSESQSAAHSVVAEELRFEFHQVEESVLADYLELLNDDKRAELERDVLSWEALGQNRENLSRLEQSFQRVYRDYHTIKGSARFIRADLSEKVIHRAEDIIAFCKRFLERLAPEDFERLTSLNLRVFDVLWTLRDGLQSDRSERGFWERPELKASFLEILSDLNTFNEELQKRNLEVDLEALKEAF